MTAKKYSLIAIIALPLILATYSLAVFAGFIALIRNSHRAPDIRWVNDAYRANVLDLFIKHKKKEINGGIILLGDSQLYGFKVNEKFTFPFLMSAALGKNVINFAVPGGSVTDAARILKIIQNNGLRPKIIIYGLDIEFLSDKIEKTYCVLPDSFPRKSNLFLLSQNVANILFKQMLFNYTSKNQKELGPEPENVARKTFCFSGRNDLNLINLLQEMKRAGERAVIVAVPRNKALFRECLSCKQPYFSALVRYKEMVAQSEIAMLDITEAMDDDCFFDMTHFTHRGHKKMAELLSGYLGALPR
ncbi:MAG: hypothetical protein PHC61_04385 [Chitinivibrionales bacterium]|nr:hypothetical protein [Chitinivibrionales bacterium]